MTISFNQVPASIRVPFLYAEFDNTKAIQGPTRQPYRALLIGPKLGAGSAASGSVSLISSSASEADSLFGQGSLLAQMAKAFREANTVQELYCMAVDDDGGSVAATGSIEITSAPTKAGTLALYVAGKRVDIAVSAGQTTDSVASALEAALDADADLLISADVDGGNASLINFTAKNKGITGNDIDVRLNYQSDDETPEGLATTITAMSGGTGQPDLTSPLAALDEKQYILMASAFNDSGNRAEIEQELADRFGPLRQNDGYCFYYKKDSFANLVTFGSGLNSQFTVMHRAGGPEHGASQISRKLGVVCQAGEIDPARPFQNLEVAGMLAESESEQLSLEDRNTLLFNGIATDKVVGGKVFIEREVTTYQQNAAGADDTSYLDLNTLLTLSFLRYDWRNYMLSKYPRHKLGNDGQAYGEGQAIMTPNLGRAEAIKKFREWEQLALVEGADQFKEDLIVERNVSDPNRLDFLLPPDLVNQLRVIGTQIQFLL